MSRPRLLDLFCKAGGAGMGYHMAGFDVIGVDIDSQPNYPFEFRQADVFALDPAGMASEFDAVHGSPMCRDHTTLAARVGRTESARHRAFECSFEASGTGCEHGWQDRHAPYLAFQGPSKGATRRRTGTIAVHGGGQIEGGGERFYKSVAMGIDWMTPAELNQAIPPAYTLFLGRQLLPAAQELAALRAVDVVTGTTSLLHTTGRLEA